MRLSEIIDRLSLDVLTPASDVDSEVTGAYCGDLLSHVLAKAAAGDLWITIQHHANIVAVAQVTGLQAVLIVDGRSPNEETLTRAKDGGIILLGTSESAFIMAGRLHTLLAD
ncbi:serine kinase [Candidatus Bipolaricaulota bacterium]|nr:serine kinase [Candidatus Bipolaricaulota bacterium]